MMNKTILIIENEIEILLSLREFLELEGYAVLTAENGLAAMELLKTSIMPNLILLDMKMPVMDGVEFARVFAGKYENRSPIIAITAGVDAEEQAKQVKAIDYESKPFDIDKLLMKIKQHAR